MVNVPPSHVSPVHQKGYEDNCLPLFGILSCIRKAHLSQFGNEAENGLRVLLLISRKTQEGVRNHLFLEL